jgi:hypothetical protein
MWRRAFWSKIFNRAKAWFLSVRKIKFLIISKTRHLLKINFANPLFAHYLCRKIAHQLRLCRNNRAERPFLRAISI